MEGKELYRSKRLAGVKPGIAAPIDENLYLSLDMLIKSYEDLSCTRLEATSTEDISLIAGAKVRVKMALQLLGVEV